MSYKKGKRSMQVRVTPAALTAIKRLHAEFANERVFQEDLVAASWLWMKTLPIEKLKGDLLPFLRAIEWEMEGQTQTQSPQAEHIEPSKPRKAGRQRG